MFCLIEDNSNNKKLRSTISGWLSVWKLFGFVQNRIRPNDWKERRRQISSKNATNRASKLHICKRTLFPTYVTSIRHSNLWAYLAVCATENAVNQFNIAHEIGLYCFDTKHLRSPHHCTRRNIVCGNFNCKRRWSRWGIQAREHCQINRSCWKFFLSVPIYTILDFNRQVDGFGCSGDIVRFTMKVRDRYSDSLISISLEQTSACIDINVFKVNTYRSTNRIVDDNMHRSTGNSFASQVIIYNAYFLSIDGAYCICI